MNPRPSGFFAEYAPEPDVLSWLSSEPALMPVRDLDYGPVIAVADSVDKR